ncbi:MAG: tetratricopeptide repeat protein [bacterium]|nr:tetratricopeptide repeat protein [bacterium]
MRTVSSDTQVAVDRHCASSLVLLGQPTDLRDFRAVTGKGAYDPLTLHGSTTGICRGGRVPSKSMTRSGRTTDRGRSKGRPKTVKRSPGKAASSDRAALGESIGALFRTAREVQGLSQDQVAALAANPSGSVSRTTVSSIERGRLPNLEALVALSRVLHVDPGEVLEQVDLATGVPVDVSGMSYDTLMDRARGLFWAGDFRRALAFFDAALHQLVLDPPDEDSERVRCHASIEINRAIALRRCGALRSARAAAEKAVELAGDSPHLQSTAYVALTAVLVHLGQRRFAADAARHAFRLATSDGQKAVALLEKADLLDLDGDHEAGYSTLLEARKLLGPTTSDPHIVHVEGGLGHFLLAMGRTKRAQQKFVKAIELARKQAMPGHEALWMVELGRLCLRQDDLEQAEGCAVAALRISKPLEQHETSFRAEWLRHLVVRARKPKNPDRHRMVVLRKLYRFVRENRKVDAVLEYEAELGRSEKGGRST